LLELLGVDSPSSTAVDLAIDGSRLLSLCARELRGGSGGEFEGYFREKYGPTGSVARRERFLQVLQFVDVYASEIERNGFGRVGPTMGIHAELLRHLLDFPVSPHTAMIPARALGKFYDDWGQHWF
jgi:hypothetical protein